MERFSFTTVEMKEIGCMFMWVFFGLVCFRGVFVQLRVVRFYFGGGLGLFFPFK